MDLNYSPEETAFRDEVRSWIKANLPDALRDKVLNYRELAKDDLLSWHKILAKKGWVAPFWPKERTTPETRRGWPSPGVGSRAFTSAEPRHAA